MTCFAAGTGAGGVGGYRSPSSLSAMGGGSVGDPRGANYGGYKELRRTPSTSAIYETLRRSKELRESLSSRPSSRLSLRGESTVYTIIQGVQASFELWNNCKTHLTQLWYFKAHFRRKKYLKVRNRYNILNFPSLF